MAPRFPRASGPDTSHSTNPVYLHGTFVDLPNPITLRIRPETEITISPASGRILSISPPGRQFWSHPPKTGPSPATPSRPRIIIPGFVDTHLHAPQYSQLATKTDLPLLEWLQTYTFPAESAFSDVHHSGKVYTRLVKRLLRNGTTSAVMYGSNHLEATKTLAEICGKIGLRAAIGKTCSDLNVPDGYRETTEGSLKAAREFVKWCQAKWPSTGQEGGEGLVVPVITPRFIPTCSPELLSGLGAIATEFSCRVQTHVAESIDQVLMVQSQYPDLIRDIPILAKYNLLSPLTILAHCPHLTDLEAREIARIGTAISSCPLSNLLFARAVLPVRRFQEMGVKVGLGTDVAGGHSISMLSAVRQAGLVSRIHGFRSPTEEERHLDKPVLKEESEEEREKWEGEIVDWKRAFWMATRGGAEAAGWKMVGGFEVGMKWDAVEIDVAWDEEEEEEAGVKEEPLEMKIERWIVGHGGEEGIRRVWVDGMVVMER